MPKSSPRIFISYRRDDADGYAGRLSDALAERFGAEHVFIDVASIPPGGDFVAAIREAIASCDAFVPVIGSRWLGEDGSKGARRIDEVGDVVRLEIEAALEQDVPVIPVLVGGASMPSGEELPASVQALSRRNAIQISSARWAFDVSQLVAALDAGAHDDAGWMPPRDLQYAHADGASIAFEITGSGPVDLVYLPSWVSNIEWNRRYPPYHAWLEDLSQLSRLIVIDRRGNGCSDGVAVSLETYVDDLIAVLDAAGSRRAVLLGVQETTLIALLAAATRPKRIKGLVLYDACASFAPTGDEASTWDEEDWKEGLRAETAWGSLSWTTSWAQTQTPSLLEDDRALGWLTTLFRLTSGPEEVHTQTRVFSRADARAVLPLVKAPTLVLRRSGDVVFTEGECRYVVDRLENALYEELPGEDAMPWAGDATSVTAAIAGFLAR